MMTRTVILLVLTPSVTSGLPPSRTQGRPAQRASSRATSRPRNCSPALPAPVAVPQTNGSGVSNAAPAIATGTSRVYVSNGRKLTSYPAGGALNVLSPAVAPRSALPVPPMLTHRRQTRFSRQLLLRPSATAVIWHSGWLTSSRLAQWFEGSPGVPEFKLLVPWQPS